MDSKLKVTLWASGTPEQFILHVCSMIHTCKQMKHDVKYSNAKEAVATVLLNLEITKDEYVQVCNQERKKTKGNKGGSNPTNSESLEAAKSAYENAAQVVDATQLAIMMEGAKAFKFYRNLLSDEARQPWEKIVQAQMTKCPWEDVYGVTHDETPTKTWGSFLE